MIITTGDRELYLPAQREQRVLSLLTAWCSHKTFSSSYQLYLISDLRSFKPRPIFDNRSAVALPVLASQDWETTVAYLSQIRAVQVWGAIGQELCLYQPLSLENELSVVWKKIPALPQHLLLALGDSSILDFKVASPLFTEQLFWSISEVSSKTLFTAFSSFNARASSHFRCAEWQWMFVKRPQITPSVQIRQRVSNTFLSRSGLLTTPVSDNSLISNSSRLKAF